MPMRERCLRPDHPEAANAERVPAVLPLAAIKLAIEGGFIGIDRVCEAFRNKWLAAFLYFLIQVIQGAEATWEARKPLTDD